MLLLYTRFSSWVRSLLLCVLAGCRTNEGTEDVPVRMMVSAKDKIPSRIPWSYAEMLDPDSPKCILHKDDLVPGGFMSWCFYLGTTDRDRKTDQNSAFFFALNAKQIRPMMDGLSDLHQNLVDKLAKRPDGVLVGQKRLATLGRRVGDRLKLAGLTPDGLPLEVEIVGVIPGERYSLSGIMNQSHFRHALDEYERSKGMPHAVADRPINVIWLKVRNQAAFNRVAAQIQGSPLLAARPLMCETIEQAQKRTKVFDN